MSASPAEASACPHCGADVPDGARFCPSCGGRLDEGSTAVIPPPPDETGRVPMTVSEAEPHLFGVTPRLAVLVLAVAALTLGVVLLVVDRLVAGFALLAVSVLLLAAFAAASRPRSGPRLGQRVRVVATAAGARSTATREATRLRHELARLEGERAERLRVFGEATYSGEDADPARTELEALDMRIAAARRELQLVAARAQEKVAQARLETQPTEVVEPPPAEQRPQD